MYYRDRQARENTHESITLSPYLCIWSTCYGLVCMSTESNVNIFHTWQLPSYNKSHSTRHLEYINWFTATLVEHYFWCHVLLVRMLHLRLLCFKICILFFQEFFKYFNYYSQIFFQFLSYYSEKWFIILQFGAHVHTICDRKTNSV